MKYVYKEKNMRTKQEELIIATLSVQIKEYLATGGKVQQIPIGRSGQKKVDIKKKMWAKKENQ
tara:strand:- start:275 stop:463 length:189 start_codon:yes stop_codon:yes gene_type:complete